MQIEKALTKDSLCISKVSWKFQISTIYKYNCNLPMKFAIFLKSIAYFLTVSFVFSVYKQNFMA